MKAVTVGAKPVVLFIQLRGVGFRPASRSYNMGLRFLIHTWLICAAGFELIVIEQKSPRWLGKM